MLALDLSLAALLRWKRLALTALSMAPKSRLRLSELGAALSESVAVLTRVLITRLTLALRWLDRRAFLALAKIGIELVL